LKVLINEASKKVVLRLKKERNYTKAQLVDYYRKELLLVTHRYAQTDIFHTDEQMEKIPLLLTRANLNYRIAKDIVPDDLKV